MNGWRTTTYRCFENRFARLLDPKPIWNTNTAKMIPGRLPAQHAERFQPIQKPEKRIFATHLYHRVSSDSRLTRNSIRHTPLQIISLVIATDSPFPQRKPFPKSPVAQLS